MYGLGLGQANDTVALYLFRYAGTSTTKWDNSIIDWSDSSNERLLPAPGNENAVCNQLHQVYDSATVNFSASFANYSSGMRAAQDNINGISDYDDYSRFRPSCEYITNRKVNLGAFINSDGSSSLQRNFTFRPNNYSIGGLANRTTNTLHAWQRFRDGTAGAKEGMIFGTWNTLNGTTHQLLAAPYVCNSSTYRDKSLISYATTNNGNTAITLVDWGLTDSTVPFKPSAAAGCGDMIITKAETTAGNGCTGYGVGIGNGYWYYVLKPAL